MVKQQQMCWTKQGAHLFLHVRTQVLNDDLRESFERWHPAMKKTNVPIQEYKTMPMPYSHLALAQSCLSNLAVDDRNDFYLGALMPDIRYFTGRPRSEYHFSIEKLNIITKSITVSNAFVLGYGIHLLIDELWATDELRDEYKRLFPFFIRSKLNIRLLEAALEIACLAHYAVPIQLQIKGNALTRQLGVRESDALTSAVQSLQRYIDQRNLQTGLQMAEASGKYTLERLAQMRYLSNALEMSRFTRALVHLLIIPPSQRIYKRLVDGALARVGEVRLSNERKMNSVV
ncbi:MAG: hypothetical protein MI924_03390 [Chloroflexales bacterium]|nr:hypothetical protein [Chloroflexales bacterium]